MVNILKILDKILSGNSDQNIAFREICNILKRLGFNERIKGSHHIFWKEGLQEIINLQAKGSKTKPYQVKQVRNIILNYKLSMEKNDE